MCAIIYFHSAAFPLVCLMHHQYDTCSTKQFCVMPLFSVIIKYSHKQIHVDNTNNQNDESIQHISILQEMFLEKTFPAIVGQ